jgi:hypothetical protein
VSDVTAEEVETARAIVIAWHSGGKPPYPHEGLVSRIATALAVRAREARRDALREALAAVDGCSDLYDATGAIRALLGSET